MKIESSGKHWAHLIGCLALGAVLGWSVTTWQNLGALHALQGLHAISTVHLHANMIRQLSRGDVTGSLSAHREIITAALIEIDMVASSDSNFTDSKEVLEARRIAAEVGAGN